MSQSEGSRMKQPMNRSSGGCWTCRIRHRKCDELRPVCKECSDRLISCHGYGPRPEWVDDQAQLDAELTRIKRAVNENFRRNKRLRKGKGRSSKAKKPTDGDYDDVLDLSDAVAPRVISSSEGMTFRESHLLIHYLDYIFPLQFPYYVDNPELGGRGWLFWLLMRNGPLNQAVLTLSALDHYTRFACRTGSTEEELIEYHTRALQGLRQTLRQYEAAGFAASNDRFMIDFLACGTTLLSFEVFRGGTASWQPHLNALSMMVNGMAPSPSQTQSRLDGESPTAASKGTGSIKNAHTFLVATSLWFDLLACTSSGKSPNTDYKTWLDEGGIDMAPFMGCYNWTMIAIGDIGTLNDRITSGGVELLADALDIKKQLEVGLGQLDAATEPPIPRAHAVSRVFATAALVELHTICPELCTATFGVADAVARMMEAIRLLPDRVSLRGLTWPICIAGSMAEPDQQPFFDTMMVKILSPSAPGFSNCDTVLRIMRQCWHHRRNYPGDAWNWRDAMKDMGICALLV